MGQKQLSSWSLGSYLESGEDTTSIDYTPLSDLRWTCCGESGDSLTGCIEDHDVHDMDPGKQTEHCTVRKRVDGVRKGWQIGYASDTSDSE